MARGKNTEKVTSTPVVVEPPVRKVDFNVWYAMREKSIPPQHFREILLADFKARGLSNSETVETFDKALAAYGIQL